LKIIILCNLNKHVLHEDALTRKSRLYPHHVSTYTQVGMLAC